MEFKGKISAMFRDMVTRNWNITIWESMVYGFPNVDKWRGQRVTTIINGGRYQGL